MDKVRFSGIMLNGSYVCANNNPYTKNESITILFMKLVNKESLDYFVK